MIETRRERGRGLSSSHPFLLPFYLAICVLSQLTVFNFNLPSYIHIYHLLYLFTIFYFYFLFLQICCPRDFERRPVRRGGAYVTTLLLSLYGVIQMHATHHITNNPHTHTHTHICICILTLFHPFSLLHTHPFLTSLPHTHTLLLYSTLAPFLPHPFPPTCTG